MTVQYDQKLLDTLEPEEREALTGSEYSEDELAAMKEVAGEDDEGDGEDVTASGDKADDGKEDNGKAAIDGGDANTQLDATAAETGFAAEESEEATARRSYQASLPEDFDSRVTTLDTAEAELVRKLKDGEIEMDEFLVENKRIGKERVDLDRMRTKAELAVEMGEQAAQQEWQDSVFKFIKQAKKNEDIDYLADQDKLSDFDSIIKALAAKPENADKSFNWFLTRAHKAAKALHGVSDKGDDGKNPKEVNRKPPLASVPQTLAQIPGSDGPGDLAGEFADIDRLEGDKLEDAIAKMSPAQRERYLQAA